MQNFPPCHRKKNPFWSVWVRASLLFVLACCPAAHAAAIWRNPSSGSWSTATNWSIGRPPDANSGSTFITNANSKTVTIGALTPATNLLIHGLTVAAPAASTNTLLLLNLGTNNPLALIEDSTLTIAAGGALRVTNSSLLVTGQFISFNVWAGEVTLDSGSIVARDVPDSSDPTVFTRIGRTNLATLTINGGEMHVTDLKIAESPNVAWPRSTGIVKLTGGALRVDAELSIGDSVSCTGLVEMVGGELFIYNHQTNVMRIGNQGPGRMTIANATAWVGNVSVARHSNAVGTLILQDNGMLNGADDFSIGRFDGATGMVVLAGGQLLVTSNSVWVGREGTGQLVISNGLVQAKELYVALTNTAQGMVTLSGGTVMITSEVLLGTPSLSTGQVVVAGGEFIATNESHSAEIAIRGGSFTLNGGLTTTDNLLLTQTNGLMVFNGGTLRTGGTMVSNGLPFVVGDGSKPATLELLGGTHRFTDGLVISSNATLTGCGVIIGAVVNQGVIATNCGTAAPPRLTQTPTSLTVTQGAVAVFMVAADGTPPLYYQWHFQAPGTNGVMIADATNATLIVSNAGPANAGAYYVFVTNASGTATSEVATLRVLVPAIFANSSFATNALILSFPSWPGLNYTIEFTESLRSPSWTTLDTRTGTGGVLTVMDAFATVPARFYRIRVE